MTMILANYFRVKLKGLLTENMFNAIINTCETIIMILLYILHGIM